MPMYNLKSELLRWRHLFKLDPDRTHTDGQLEALLHSGTDALMIGGSSGVTYEKTAALAERLRGTALPVLLEISDAAAIVSGMDGYLVPFVLNTDDPRWMWQEQQKAVQAYGEWIPWERVVAEAYVILNPQATAAKLTGADATIEIDEVKAYCQMAEHLLRFPVIYLEYSGTFGDMQLVQSIKDECRGSRLFYGGGIKSAAQAEAAARHADTVIVGNIIYENMEQALQTVKGVRQADHKPTT